MEGELFRLSYSKIECFLRCPRQYWFRYVSGERWPEQRDTPAGIAGTGVHRAMQKLCLTGDPVDGEAELDAYLRMPKHAAAGPGTEWHRLALEWYAAGVEAHRSIVAEASWAEAANSVNFAGISLYGGADRVDRLGPDRWQVIDWKTGRFALGPAEDRQLDVLHVVVRGLKKLPAGATVRAVAWNLRTGEQRVRELTRGDAARQVAYLARMARQMLREREFAPSPGPQCGFCDWRDRCDAAAAVEIDGLDWVDEGLELAEAWELEPDA